MPHICWLQRSSKPRSAACWLLASLILLSPASLAQTEQTKEEESAERVTDLPEEPQSEEDRMWVDGFRDGVQTFVDGTARWVDSFFGEQLNPSDYEGNQGRFTVAPQWDEHEGFEVDSSFRAKLIIPHAKEQFSAVIGRGDFDDFISERDDRRPSVLRRNTNDDEWMVGLGFDPYLNEKHDLSFGAGIRGGLRLDTYVRARYRFETILSNTSEMNVQSVAFWRDSDGFGVSQDAHYEKALTEKWIARWYGRGTFAERTDGIRWNTNGRMYYLYHEERAVATEVWWAGESSYEVPLLDYGIRGIHRQRFKREWLFMETWVGMHWPRDYIEQKRTSRWMVGIEFEILFGGRT